jgi:periplasmic divalent cation tolerance protein
MGKFKVCEEDHDFGPPPSLSLWADSRGACRLSSDLRLVLTTCGSRETADRIAAALVGERLAACVNVLPGARSTFRWQDRIESEEEVVMLIKTAEPQLPAIESTIRALSGYELPELIAVEISGGAKDYLEWVETSIGAETT